MPVKVRKSLLPNTFVVNAGPKAARKLIKLLALDIDDTLIRGSQEVRAENLEAVAEAKRAGVLVTIVTGRRWQNSAEKYARLLETVWPVGTVYGARLIDARTGRLFKHTPLEKDVALEIISFAEANNYAVSVLLDETVHLNRRIAWGERPAWTNVIIEAGVTRKVAAGAEGPTSLMIWETEGVEAVAAAFSRPLAGKVDFMFHHPEGQRNGAMTVISAEANKGRALLDICGLLGVDPSEVLAMGDSSADIPMIRAAGIGVAMGWAEEDVRQAADDVASADDPHPVATMIRRHILGGNGHSGAN